MTDRAGARIVEKLIKQFGCLPDACDGPTLPGFNPTALADAIAHEAKRAGEYGWSKITIHMDIPDAVQLMLFLRQGK